MPATIAAEMRKAYETLVISRRLRHYAERWIHEHNARLTAGFTGCETAAPGGRRLSKVVILKQPSDRMKYGSGIPLKRPRFHSL
jgi:hypothetical protein